MDLGKDIEERVVEEKVKSQRANQCAAVVFSVIPTIYSVYSSTIVLLTTVRNYRTSQECHDDS